MALTLMQVAEKLGCTYQTVYKLVKSGELKAFRVGSDYRVRPEVLEALMEGK
jgi:excisionase family DNA binding protein